VPHSRWKPGFCQKPGFSLWRSPQRERLETGGGRAAKAALPLSQLRPLRRRPLRERDPLPLGDEVRDVHRAPVTMRLRNERESRFNHNLQP